MIMKFMKQDHGIKNSIDNEKKFEKLLLENLLIYFQFLLGVFEQTEFFMLWHCTMIPIKNHQCEVNFKKEMPTGIFFQLEPNS